VNQQKPKYHEKLVSHWTIVLGLAVLAVVVCILLWRSPSLRPYVAAFGAGCAALLSPLLALIPPKGRGDWLTIGGIACMIGLGTWYSVDAIEREKDTLELKIHQLDEQHQRQTEAFAAAISSLPNDNRSTFILNTARRMRELYRQRNFAPVLDLAGVLATVDQENGHALYYEGEAYRAFKDRAEMRGVLQRYLQASDYHSEARDGAADECYKRPAGYCGERTAWIDHLMANDYYQESRSPSNLGTAFYYEKHVLAIRPQGFYRLQSVDSSCGLMQAILTALRKSRQDVTPIELELQHYRAKYGPC